MLVTLGPTTWADIWEKVEKIGGDLVEAADGAAGGWRAARMVR
ncbi:MAG: hypothetical protein R3E48_15630 [Burkholderiaceae bacterium]